MAIQGPAKRPLEETRRLGNPTHRPLPAPQTTHALARLDQNPPISANLGTAGMAMWRHVAALPWVGESDGVALLRTCRLMDLLDQLDEDIANNGISYESRGRLYANPVIKDRAVAEKQLVDYLALFGLTPSDRARQGIAEVRAASKWEQMMRERAESEDDE